jgi:hypothetical protein
MSRHSFLCLSHIPRAPYNLVAEAVTTRMKVTTIVYSFIYSL